MVTASSGEAGATSNQQHGPPEASLDIEKDGSSADSSPRESQSLDVLPTEVPREDVLALHTPEQDAENLAQLEGPNAHERSTRMAVTTGQQAGQAFMQTATLVDQEVDQTPKQTTASSEQDADQTTSTAKSTSADKDQSSDPLHQDQEGPDQATSVLPPNPGTLQAFVGFQNPVWDRLAENTWTNGSRTVSPSNSQSRIKTSRESSYHRWQLAITPSAVKAELSSASPPETLLSVETADPFASDASGSDLRLASALRAVAQGAEGSTALNPDERAGSPVGTKEDVTDDLSAGQSPAFLSSPEGSTPPSPDPYQLAMGRNLLDPNLYRPDEENDYMRSMTSLLGGGEASISSLADILVWSDTAMGMGLAVGFLASGHSSPANLLQDEGPSLRSVSSLLGSARSALSSGLLSGTGSALRSVTHLLGSVERRTVEGIRSAVRYFTSRLAARWARSSPNSD